MVRFGARTLIAACLLVSAPALGSQPEVARMVERLESHDEYLVRVQAALALGSLADEAARVALEEALVKDDHAAVRAAAARALGSLGDERAAEALEQGTDDSASTVRTQAAQALLRLRGDKEVGTGAKVLIQLGSLQNKSNFKSPLLEHTLRRASRTGLGALSGVRIVWQPPNETQQKVPLILISGLLKQLQTTRSGAAFICEARIEYVLQRMPGRVIAAVVSGKAKRTVPARWMSDPDKRQELRREVVEAAVASAVRRTSEALARVTRR